ncbi:MAG: right-handed parallel beta-helix repeat-containing protein [Pseudomonadota bacterium]|nr:right-handed parallel beta-helix repeat-containing protein [Pseudomonadota bacterium]
MRSLTRHSHLSLLAFSLWGCGAPSEPCACTDGHGVTLCEGGDCTSCQCLDLAPPTEDPEPAVTRFVDADAPGGDGSEADPWAVPDWETLDADVATGHVLVLFDAGDTWPEHLAIRRTDTGPNRIVLDGHRSRVTSGEWVDAEGARAIVPGIATGFENVVRSRITVRGFDVTGSEDKGIYWRAGDDIVIEDNLVHANRGTPSISLDYTSRSGHRSTSFVVRNNHVWDQAGECIYIGGAEGEDLDAHEVVVIENNLVHDCFHPFSSQADGINIKDRIGSVTVARNVVFETKWGIEIASPSNVRGNLVFATRSNGIHVTDDWGLGLSGLVLEDNAILDAEEAGIYLNATSNAWSNVTLSRLTVVGAREAAIEAGGEGGIDGTIDDVVLARSSIGLDAWSPMGFALGKCTVHGNALAGDRELAALAEGCVDLDPGFGDLGVPAGPDGRFFTEDDPWVSASGGARPDGG